MHICTGTGLTPATSAPGLDLAVAPFFGAGPVPQPACASQLQGGFLVFLRAGTRAASRRRLCDQTLEPVIFLTLPQRPSLMHLPLLHPALPPAPALSSARAPGRFSRLWALDLTWTRGDCCSMQRESAAASVHRVGIRPPARRPDPVCSSGVCGAASARTCSSTSLRRRRMPSSSRSKRSYPHAVAGSCPRPSAVPAMAGLSRKQLCATARAARRSLLPARIKRGASAPCMRWVVGGL
jgi:hypothetical protein